MRTAKTSEITIPPSDIAVNIDPETLVPTDLDITSAAIISFCQQQGRWTPFTEDDLRKVMTEPSILNFYVAVWLNELKLQEFINVGEEGAYHITEKFANHNHQLSPAGNLKIKS